MNILLIGNGFDLAHGLPTTYADFLLFWDFADQLINEKSNNINAEEFSGINIKLKSYMSSIGYQTPFISGRLYRLSKLAEHNFWKFYFLQNQTYMKENWIDFESEISRVVRQLNALRECVVNKNQERMSEYIKDSTIIEIAAILCDADRGFHISFGGGGTYIEDIQRIIQRIEEIDSIIKRLERDLNSLVCALEIYLADFVCHLEIERKIPEIEQLELDKVISFNYTDTYQRIYGHDMEIEYDYIHGRATKMHDRDTNNMVLGIDEYLDASSKDKDVSCIGFKKYFQRVYKMTDNGYLDWINTVSTEQNSNNDPIHLYVFGHSLDVTDKDVLEMYLCHENVETTIFYHGRYDGDNQTVGRLVTNLVKVIGSTELIRRTGGKNKTITFVQQGINSYTFSNGYI